MAFFLGRKTGFGTAVGGFFPLCSYLGVMELGNWSENDKGGGVIGFGTVIERKHGERACVGSFMS